MSTTIVHTFNQPFSSVVSVFWNKFPNDHSPHVKTIDYLDRTLTGNILSTCRLFGVDAGHNMLPATRLYSVETTSVNPTAGTLAGINKNISLRSIFDCTELFTYTQNANGTTTYIHDISIAVHIPVLGAHIQKMLLDAAREKSEQSIAHMTSLLNK